MGDVMPAGVQLFNDDFISIDKSLLTAESLSVTKKESVVDYMNTIIKQGECKCWL
ncbi:hypothetical protein H4J68_09095 [Colwellia sp. MB3u-28]|nr:hypothetical protein [Colwellia sp. MB02u-7]MBA6236931.1 hypothetical protein [Colwellia sp. MB02u-11]MBA6256126.1 hypothetical protein [Colwellia sp. MB3u-28]MBA6259357.1 hypothetical protein [Colwellia sp. MB3u-41]MBA6300679.1 hypothetical protein [Colwellia sp. MB3u-22]MBA6304440.1 hypothetical protein [Colwellia sp. MB02u-14]MBA6310562.1 hypothetical protein [Colwellia sp. MB3u-64]